MYRLLTFTGLAVRALAGRLTLILGALALSVSIGHAQVERIAVVVNDDVITTTDLRNRLTLSLVASGLQASPENQQRLAPQILRTLIDERLQMQEARRLGVAVEQQEIDQAIVTIARRNNLAPGEFLGLLQRSGVSPATLQEQIETQLAWRDVVRSRLMPSVQVGDAEIDDLARQMAATAGQREYLVSEIFLGIDDPSREGEIVTFANQLASQIRRGGNFAAVAAQFSQAVGAAQGGDVGWVLEGQLAPEIDAMLGQMSPGQVSDPIRTLSGYHIVALRDTRTATMPSPDDREITLARLILPFSGPPSQEEAELLVVEAREAAQGVISCEGITSVAETFGTAQASTPQTITIRQLPEGLRALVEEHPIGLPTEPVATAEGVIVFMVCDREGLEGFARDDMREQLMQERIDLLQRRYLRDLRAAAFVEIRL
ncbi:MAG: peptidylprolyl isomerase [Pseudomonadota bacterium]